MTETTVPPVPVSPTPPLPVLPSKAVKPGWKTTEFYLTLLTALLPWLATNIPDQWKAGLSVVSGLAYTLARGLAKLNP